VGTCDQEGVSTCHLPVIMTDVVYKTCHIGTHSGLEQNLKLCVQKREKLKIKTCLT